MSKSRFFCGGSALAVTLVLSVGAQSAMAQQGKAPPTPTEDVEVSEVITTGTYIRGAAEDAALPVEVTTRDELEKLGNPTVNELVRGMSEAGNLMGEDNRNGGNIPGVATINLRNLTSGRTLVLLNGNRLPQISSPSTAGDTQDSSVIPSEVLQQVEVLKDGGSTTYGSDAVSGVVNFKTRTDLNGMEATASYKYVAGSDGDYDGNIQWGRRNDTGNVLLSFAYTHRSEILNAERDWMREYALFNIGNGGFGAAASGGWSPQSVPGAYSFLTAPGAATTAFPVGSNATSTVVRANAATAGLLADATSTAVTAGGTVRDPLCNQLGGFRGFQTVLGQTVPVCLANFLMAENLVQAEDRYRVFGDANFDINDKWRLNVGFNFAKNVTPERTTGGTSGNNTGGTAPCDPYDTYVTNSTTQARNCLQQTFFGATNTTAPASAAGYYYVTGYNPAMQHFEQTAALIPTAQAGGGTPGVGYYGANYFTSAQAATLTSCLPGITTAYTGGPTCASLGADAPGRSQLRVSGFNGHWSPIGMDGNRAFDGLRATERYENTQVMLTTVLKGSVGELFGSQIDLRVSANYNHSYLEQAGKGILVDRLQRALNGFATNLNDRSGGGGAIDRCTAGETMGVRPGALSATPFSAGAGGGWGQAPGTGGSLGSTATVTNYGGVAGSGGTIAGSTIAGNGCYFYNPFASAIASTNFGQQKYTNVTGSPTQYGFVGTGFYQGYGNPSELTLNTATNQYTVPGGYAGTGLQNDLGVLNWLYENRFARNTQDFLVGQVVFNGVGGLELPGGPLAWAAGGEYRFYRRDQRYDTLSDRSKNPCSFISTATGTSFATRAVIATENDINIPGRQRLTASIQDNYSVSCTGLTNTTNANAATGMNGVWFDGFGGTEYIRNNRTISAFGELSLPLLDNLSAQLQTRYEDTTGYSGFPASAVVSGGALRWAITDKLTLRASASQTFDGTDCSCDPGLNSTTPQSGTTGVITGTSFVNTTVDNSTVTFDSTGNVVTTGPAGPYTTLGTRADIYGNTQLQPETGSNYSVGFIFRPTSALELQLQLSDIKVKGTPVALTATTLARRMMGKGSAGQQLETQDFILSSTNNLGGANAAGFNCFTDQTLFHNVDPSSGQSLVRFLGANGAIVEGCTTQAIADQTTLNGFTDTANVLGGGAQHYSLLYSLPNQVNAGGLNTRSIDMSLAYRFPNTVFGGVTTFGSDLTYLLFYNTTDTVYNGAVVATGQKQAGGTFGSSAAVRLRGSLSVTWVKGKNTVTVREHILTSMVDFTGTGISIPALSATSGAYTNYNPANNTVCNTAAGNAAILSLAPDPRMDVSAVLGAPGVGEAPINNNCNIGNYVGGLTHGAVWTDMTYIRALSDSLKLTVLVENIFDTPPPFSKQTQYYYASAGMTGLGRTVKVQLRKKF